MKTLAVNKLTASPLVSGSQISAMTPPEFVKGAHAKKPEMKRVTSRVSIFFARAWPRWKIVYKTMATTNIFLRPISSLPGPHINGYEDT